MSGTTGRKGDEMGRIYSGIDVLTCVQGNTARLISAADRYTEGCVVFDFTRETSARVYPAGTDPDGRSVCNASEKTSSGKPANKSAVRPSINKRSDAAYKERRMRSRRRRAARSRKINSIKVLVLAVFLSAVFITGGIMSSAHMRRAPEAYKYYDTITVAYQENLLDIVLRYDNRDYYDTQLDYLEELCRINNIQYDGTAYPAVSPGTHLIVPYYSTELK